MLHEGVYEQLINTRLNKEISSLDLEKYDIRLDKLDSNDARRVLTIYLSYVIQKGLRYIRDSFPASKDAEALVAQIRLCNDIVKEVAKHTGEKDFEDNAILEKGEVLTSIYRKINSVINISNQDVIRPETSIIENTLFTGSHSEPSMLSELKKEILSADRVDLLVSFIKWSAIQPLLRELEIFTKREHAKLRVIATTYTKATDYKAILTLANLPNTEVKINYETNHARMHAKSYLFKRDSGFSTVYIGSSNLSNPALTGGLEWNLKVTEKESFDIVKKCSVSFESYWNDASFELFDPNDQNCCKKLQDELSKQNFDNNNSRKLLVEVRPYAYQQEILDQLAAERNNYGHNKNLVVAATGVGKTIIAAFDYKRFKETHSSARLLFVAHRKEILEQSVQKFQEVLNDFNFGELYVAGKRPNNIEHLFVSIQSFNSAHMTKWTNEDYYDYIIIDEFHHAAADSYQDLLNYYKPKILLGLTATPERMDGKDILQYFDGRIASKMLLGEAIERNLLSTFQYYGITDAVDYRKLNWTKGRYDVDELERVYSADTKRCLLIYNSLQKHVADMEDVKGLGFCVSVKHAEYMAKYFSEKNIPSLALSSASPDDIRDDAKEKLKSGEVKFIFVVDLYNEGVDIPEVNTIMFLRPTESATVFLQQLGRGLRICPGKDCLTVLDFIGQANKKYNYAWKFETLTGKRHKSLVQQIKGGFSNLPKGCYIELERYAQEYVLTNLGQDDFNKTIIISRAKTFTEDTGKEFNLENFLTEYDLTLYEFYQASGDRSIHRVKQAAGLIDDRRDVDNSIYRRMTGLFHVDSIRLLNYWINYIEQGEASSAEISAEEKEQKRLMKNMLYYTFYSKYPEEQGFHSIDEGISEVLQEDFVKDEILQVLKYKRKHVDFVPKKNEYSFINPLDLHCQYNKNQILAAFGTYNEKSSPEFREGVKYFQDKKTDIFLINLNKSEKDFSPSTMYMDYAINSKLFHWESQSQNRESSPNIQRYIHHRETGNNISLFVREYKKNGSYTAPYTFLGNVDYVSHEGEQPVGFEWRLHEPIPASLLPKANKSIAM